MYNIVVICTLVAQGVCTSGYRAKLFRKLLAMIYKTFLVWLHNFK